MVAGVFEQRDDSLRAALENQIVKLLSDLGYNASSSLTEFGPKGLISLNEEETYVKMCDNGINAILTFALIHDSFAKTIQKGTGLKYTNTVYYNRIWNYRQLQSHAKSYLGGPEQLYKFESILFDLESLQPVSVMQSASYNLAEARQSAITVAHNLIQTMVNERIIKKQDPSTAPPKAF